MFQPCGERTFIDRPIRIATRASRLALWQAEYVRAAIEKLSPGRAVELVHVVSKGDAVRDRPLHAVGGVGLFTKEVQQLVLDGGADLAVHSLKDLPTETHRELVLAAVPPRGPVGDVLAGSRGRTLAELPAGACLATSSLRRSAQLRRHRPDLAIVDIRGNVETRLAKVADQGLDGVVLAAAGIERLGLADRIAERIPFAVMLPAVGQGALGIECRADDDATRTLLARLDDRPTRLAVEAERAFLRRLQGGCTVPIGALAELRDQTLTLRGIVLSGDGSRWFAEQVSGPADSAGSLGSALANTLLERGARALLDADRP